MASHRLRAAVLATAFAALMLGVVATPADAGTPSGQENAAVALFWQRNALRTVFAEAATPVPSSALYLGFTSLAVDDAVRTAGGRRHVSAPAAAAVAAHDVLIAYFPASAANLNADLTTSLATIPDGPAERRGTAIGRAAAAKMIASRVDDGRNASIVYSRAPAPGIWQPPPTGMAVPWLGFVKPLVLRHAVSVDGPDPIDSAAYAADFNEIKRIGSVNSTERTAAQTEIARFFSANPILQLREALLLRLDSHPLSLARTTRLFAELDAATADALIQCWRLKYDVGFWRPFQAIPAAATDGNDATTADPTWAPLLPTPPYPDYLSGHACVVAAFTSTVGPVLGDRVALRLHSSVTGTDHTYRNLRALESDAFMARIWLGFHFRDAMDDGYRLGHLTGKLVKNQYIQAR
jgi:hypothetical protein